MIYSIIYASIHTKLRNELCYHYPQIDVTQDLKKKIGYLETIIKILKLKLCGIILSVALYPSTKTILLVNDK